MNIMFMPIALKWLKYGYTYNLNFIFGSMVNPYTIRNANPMDSFFGDVSTNRVNFPQVEMKDYVEYGFGLEKHIEDNDLSTFGQINLGDSGREDGIFLSEQNS